MELTDVLSKLPWNQQLRVIERIFQKLSLAFGNQLFAKWQGMDMQDVYADWAEALQPFTLAAIDSAIAMAKLGKNAPNQGEFVDMCKQARAPQLLKIESKLTPEQLERNRQRIREIAVKFAREKSA